MIFGPGQEVVCVDASLPANPWHRAYPLTKGRTYIVRGVCEAEQCGCGRNCIDIDGSGRLWPAERFRPPEVTKTEVGMAILRKILEPA